MELKDFVKNALVEIIDGVKEAQSSTQESGGSVNPPGRGEHVSLTFGGTDIQNVEFDVAVTITEGSENSGGVAGGIAVIGIGVKGVKAPISIDSRLPDVLCFVVFLFQSVKVFSKVFVSRQYLAKPHKSSRSGEREQQSASKIIERRKTHRQEFLLFGLVGLLS